MWMGPKAFCYYVHAAINYLKSHSSDHDSSSVLMFHTALAFQLMQKADIVEAFPDLREAVQYIIDHWEKFVDLDPAIYGDLKEDYARLLGALTAER